MSIIYHVPVLCQEVLESLIIDPGKVYVDGTVGGGGHAEQICQRLTGPGRLICFDADADAVHYAAQTLERFGARATVVHANFRTLRSELSALGAGRIGGILLDLGVASFQLDEGSKGFSFRADAPLDMRMDRRQALTAREIVNGYPESDLAGLLRRYGEERDAQRIARRITQARPLATTGELARVVESAVGARFLSKSLARVFQALRIVVNDELLSLEQALTDAVDLLEPGGRIVIISYHSLEDRIVKNFYRVESAERIRSSHKYIPDTTVLPRLRIVTKKPVVPGDDEQARNSRSRSAKMRVAERTAWPGTTRNS